MKTKSKIMDVTGFIIFLALGALAGWLAGVLMKGGGFGLLGNIVVGILGAVIGGFAFSLLGIETESLIGSILTATAGAVFLPTGSRMMEAGLASIVRSCSATMNR